MTDPFDEIHEKPLDPAVERVQRRLQRLILIAGLTLGLGIFAVLAAVVYRLTVVTPASAPMPVAAGTAVPTLARSDLGLSASARLLSVAADGDRIVFAYAEDEATLVIVFDLVQMAVVNRLRISPD